MVRKLPHRLAERLWLGWALVLPEAALGVGDGQSMDWQNRSERFRHNSEITSISARLTHGSYIHKDAREGATLDGDTSHDTCVETIYNEDRDAVNPTPRWRRLK